MLFIKLINNFFILRNINWEIKPNLKKDLSFTFKQILSNVYIIVQSISQPSYEIYNLKKHINWRSSSLSELTPYDI